MAQLRGLSRTARSKAAQEEAAREALYKAIRSASRAGLSYNEIGRELGYHKTRIGQIVRGDD